jgi:hypothetical protein
MGATSRLGIRWPELSDLADGPDAFADMANDVDNAMPALRLWTAERFQAGGGDFGVGIGANQFVDVLTTRTIPLVVIGWAEISFQAQLFDFGTQMGQWAGHLEIWVNGEPVNRSRFHNHEKTFHLTARVDGPYQLPKGTAGLQVRVVLHSEPGSITPFRVNECDFSCKQYGSAR